MDSGPSGRGWAIFGRIEAVHRADFGRPLFEVIYVLDPEGDGVFVVTAYPLTGKPFKAYRRRQRRRRR